MSDRSQRAVRAAAARIIALLGRAVRADQIGNSYALLARLEEIAREAQTISELCDDRLATGREMRKLQMEMTQ